MPTTNQNVQGLPFPPRIALTPVQRLAADLPRPRDGAVPGALVRITRTPQVSEGQFGGGQIAAPPGWRAREARGRDVATGGPRCRRMLIRDDGLVIFWSAPAPLTPDDERSCWELVARHSASVACPRDGWLA